MKTFPLSEQVLLSNNEQLVYIKELLQYKIWTTNTFGLLYTLLQTKRINEKFTILTQK